MGKDARAPALSSSGISLIGVRRLFMWAPARPFHFISRHRRKGCLFDHNSHQSSPAPLVNIYTYSLLFHHYSRSLFALPNATLPTAASLLLHTLCLRAASLLKASQRFFVPPKLFSVILTSPRRGITVDTRTTQSVFY